MSQNRQATKDRIVASLDFKLNLRAKLEIVRLHEKLDRSVIDRLDAVIAQQADIMTAFGQIAPRQVPST